jgi:hypothetical protein
MTRIRFDGRGGLSPFSARCRGLPWWMSRDASTASGQPRGRRTLVVVSGPHALFVAVLVMVLAAGGCRDSRSTDHPPLRLGWHETVRDGTTCDGTWYVVGAVLGADASSRPAAWTSTDGRTWRTVALAPRQYYARRAILYSVACRGTQVAVLGARSGGAHGNPRTTSWHQRADGALVDVPAPFELFGGPDAIAVSRLAAGVDGWLIAGGRTTGAAVWVSPDAAAFRLVDDDPALSSDPTRRTSARDAVADGDGWTAVGYAELSGRVAAVPSAWSSRDGLRWRREDVPPATQGFADLERVVDAGDRLLAVGVRADRFGSWERTDGRWRAAGSFGALDPDRSTAPAVTGLVRASSRALAAVSDGVRFHLWARRGGDDWQTVALPTRARADGDRHLTVAADDQQVLLLSDDGTSGRAWVAGWNTLSR